MAGYRLKICRTDRGYRQQDIADVLGITRAAYTHYETGRNDIPISHLLKLADFYGCTTDELLGSKCYYEVVRLDD